MGILGQLAWMPPHRTTDGQDEARAGDYLLRSHTSSSQNEFLNVERAGGGDWRII